jgi:hypothetical protein
LAPLNKSTVADVNVARGVIRIVPLLRRILKKLD